MQSPAKFFVAAALIMGGWASAAVAEDAAGTWVMENGKVTIRISRCGPDLCGTIVGMAKPLDKKGRPKRDKKNPDAGKRARPLIGLRILHNMQPSGDGSWQGVIYNADDGNTYTSLMKLRGREMRVKGCVAFLCKSMDFQRVD